jgi:hypothetical protein
MMAGEFHELVNVTEVPDAHQLTMPRAQLLAGAIKEHRDFSLVRLLRYSDQGAGAFECVMVDVECDGVPPQNRFGIAYRERLALCVPENPKSMVQVLALRRDFPVLLHQNNGERSGPASLCLYFEPAAAVMRTWTAQRFLRRIQWWLEQSAQGAIHPADQPVEHLFFATKYELVLPWNYDEIRSNPAYRLAIYRGQDRPDTGFTCFVKAAPADKVPKNEAVTHLDLTLPPIVHGLVERDPTTLGELSDILFEHGVAFLPFLQAALRKLVDQAGAPATEVSGFVVTLLHFPMCRELGAEPEGMMHRAFLTPTGPLELGEAAGALMLHDGVYYNAAGVLEEAIATRWQSAHVLPMAVLRQNDAAAARRQSGITDDGPTGVLVGAGSLGSALLNLWGRSGWGRWSVIDNDHVKPHNLSKHTASARHIGCPKTVAVTEFHNLSMNGATTITPVYGDACDTSNLAVVEALCSAELVVDASTTLEYPRLASMTENRGRHISVFVTPDGASAVMLAEDGKRHIRLRTLEAQYYRALLQNEWGRHHLDGNLGTFWSGAGCRDISTVMPYSHIMVHSSTFAEQIRLASGEAQASIRVWQRACKTGAVAVHDVAVYPEQRMALGGVDLFIDGGIEQRLRQLRRAGFPDETGGILLGYHDFNVNAIVVVDALPAPVDSSATPGSFQRGIAGLADAVSEAARRTAGVVGYLGEWHSHPPGHSASPSRDDLMQLIHLALGMHEDGLPAVQLIVGELDVQVLQGSVGA